MGKEGWGTKFAEKTEEDLLHKRKMAISLEVVHPMILSMSVSHKIKIVFLICFFPLFFFFRFLTVILLIF